VDFFWKGDFEVVVFNSPGGRRQGESSGKDIFRRYVVEKALHHQKKKEKKKTKKRVFQEIVDLVGIREKNTEEELLLKRKKADYSSSEK